MPYFQELVTAGTTNHATDSIPGEIYTIPINSLGSDIDFIAFYDAVVVDSTCSLGVYSMGALNTAPLIDLRIPYSRLWIENSIPSTSTNAQFTVLQWGRNFFVTESPVSP